MVLSAEETLNVLMSATDASQDTSPTATADER